MIMKLQVIAILTFLTLTNVMAQKQQEQIWKHWN